MYTLRLLVCSLSAAIILLQVVLALPVAEIERIPVSHITPFVQDIMRLSKAAEMRNYMNESADPCNDFYKFACGNWKKINPANSVEHLTTGLFELMSHAMERKMALLLNSGPQPADTSVDKKVKDFFISCTKIKDLRDVYRDKLMKIIEEFGQMPALQGDTWQEANFDWLETVARISHKYGIDIIISLDIMPDFAENTVNRVYIGHPNFPLETKSMYLDSVTAIYRESYKLAIAEELNKFLGIKPTLAKQTAKEIMQFEVYLAKGMMDDDGVDLTDMSNLTTVEEMHKKYIPTIDTKRLVNITLGEMIDEPIYEFVPQYQRNLVNVITKTPKRIIANYVFYRLLNDFFLKIAKTPEKQQKLCITKVKSYFAKNLDNMIYRRYNTNATEQDVNLIWNELKTSFKWRLLSDQMQWIKQDTRDYAVEKLNVTKLEINSYADYEFEEEFEDLVINSHDYIENMKNLLELGSDQALAELHEPPQPLQAGELLSYTPANIIIENTIKVPVSLLQPYYLWASSYPNALKFGTLGSLVGHELIHGFDDNGRKFDKDGNSKNWWDSSSTKEFISRAKCFTEQYSKYRYGGRALAATESQSENIADNGGVRLSYDAYLKWYENAVRSGQDLQFESLPNMNYTSKQLFFISFAQVWCSDTHPRVRDLQTSTDEHTPSKFRVIGTLSNFAEFAKEFKCAADAKMNPTKKCVIY